MSRHHRAAVKTVDSSPSEKRVNPRVKACLYRLRPITLKNALNAAKNGHGLGSTIWKGCSARLRGAEERDREERLRKAGRSINTKLTTYVTNGIC
jgi:hypothetical protein